MSKVSKACDISSKVSKEVKERDGGRCIICGSQNNIQIAHYISRARLGLGIPDNLVCMCASCHYEYDNGKYHFQIKNALEDYLKQHYEGWNVENITYKKYGG